MSEPFPQKSAPKSLTAKTSWSIRLETNARWSPVSKTKKWAGGTGRSDRLQQDTELIWIFLQKDMWKTVASGKYTHEFSSSSSSVTSQHTKPFTLRNYLLLFAVHELMLKHVCYAQHSVVLCTRWPNVNRWMNLSPVESSLCRRCHHVAKHQNTL